MQRNWTWARLYSILPSKKAWQTQGCCNDGVRNGDGCVEIIILGVNFVCQPHSSDAFNMSLYASLEPFIVRMRVQHGYTRMCILEYPIIWPKGGSRRRIHVLSSLKFKTRNVTRQGNTKPPIAVIRTHIFSRPPQSYPKDHHSSNIWIVRPCPPPLLLLVMQINTVCLLM